MERLAPTARLARRSRRFAAAPLALLLAACGSQATAPAPVAAAAPTAPVAPVAPVAPAGHVAITTEKLEPFACGTIQRLHTWNGYFLASQPSADDLAQAKAGGIKTVVNLRKPTEPIGYDEAAVAQQLGLAYVTLPFSHKDELTDAGFDRARELLNGIERPALVHCASANRVGALWLAWRALDGGVALDVATAEAKTIGLKTPELEARAKEYVAARSSGAR